MLMLFHTLLSSLLSSSLYPYLTPYLTLSLKLWSIMTMKSQTELSCCYFNFYFFLPCSQLEASSCNVCKCNREPIVFFCGSDTLSSNLIVLFIQWRYVTFKFIEWYSCVQVPRLTCVLLSLV